MSHDYPDESTIIIEQTLEWFSNSNENINTFAVDILAPKLGKMFPETPKEYEDSVTALRRQVRRYLGGSHPFPLAWKWVWLDCLPNKYRNKALSKICGIHGFLDTLPPIENGTGCDASFDELMHNVATMVSESAPAHDGKYDQNDQRDAADRYIDSMLTLAVGCIDEARKVHAGTGATGSRHNITKFTTDEE